MSYRIVVSDTKVVDSQAVRSAFEDAVVEPTTATDPEAVIEAAAGADAMIVDANVRVTEPVLEALESLQVVGRSGIGVDNVDVAAADRAGVTVCNVPEYCLDEVSTHALVLALACLRRLHQYDRSVAGGDWDWTVGAPIDRLAGSTIGLVAFGKIARRLASKLRGFDVSVLAYDPYVSDSLMAEFGVEQVGFDELLQQASIVSIHAPLTEETRGLFDAAAFAQMRTDAILVNTARGPIVDEGALEDALAAGEIDAAGLDVRDPEPPGDSPLHDRADVICTPHVGWYSEASRAELSESIAADVARVLHGEEPRSPVDPESGWF